MLRGVTLGAGLLVGCIDVHPFHGDAGTDAHAPDVDARPIDAPPGIVDAPVGVCTTSGGSLVDTDPMSYVNNTSTKGIDSKQLKLRFDFTSLQPTTLLIGGVEVLANSPPMCSEFSFLSTVVYPGASNFDPNATDPGLDSTVPGQGIVQMTSKWTGHYGCGSATVTTTWTAFPDDRLVRRDDVSGLTANSTTNCQCPASVSTNGTSLQTGAQFLASSYNTLVDASGTSFPSASHSGSLSMPACLTVTGSLTTAPAYDLAIATASPTTVIVATDFGLHTTVQDSVKNGAAGSTTFAIGPRNSCATLQATLLRYQSAISVTVNHTAILSPVVDGIVTPGLGGGLTGDATIEMPLEGAPPGFAVSIPFQTTKQSFEVYRNEVKLQPAEGFAQLMNGRTVVWLRDPFGGPTKCDVIRVHPI